MLAYLFWHEPGPGVDPDRYVELLRAFHAALHRAPPPSFVRSWSVRLERSPWDGGPAQPFEDWYLVDDWAALGTLNEAAVRAPRGEPHDAIAALATNGRGGLYALQHGTLDGPALWAGWVAKPAGAPYAEFEPALRGRVECDAASFRFDSGRAGATSSSRRAVAGGAASGATRARSPAWPSRRTAASS